MLTIQIVNRTFACKNNLRIAERHILNQIEFLKKSDKKNRTLYVVPYGKKDFFHEEFIRPILDKNGYIDKSKLGSVWWSNGVTYRVYESECFIRCNNNGYDKQR